MGTFCRLLATLVAVALVPVTAIAQGGATVSGRVTGENGAPVVAAAVRINALNVGTVTSEDGTYRLAIPGARAGQVVTVSASRVGLGTQARSVTLTPGAAVTANFQLAADALAVEGLVVTALGIERQERTLGVSAETVQGDALSRNEANLVSSLSGKVSGVNINTSTTPGGSSRIVIRGENSITGNNQPIFVIDGVPVDNYSGGDNIGSSAQASYDYGNAIQDIHPDAIESITVLKGPNAAALYGSRASNGAIIITTKKGRSATGAPQISVTQSTTWEDELRLPKFQNKFGQGYYGQFSYFDGDGNGTYDEYDESWGPPLNAGLMIPQWNSPLNADGTRQPTPWVASPNNVDNFFELGRTSNTGVSVSAGNERMHGRFGVSHFDQNGMLPGFELNRTTLSFGGGMGVTERFDVNTSVQYVASQGQGRPGVSGSGENPMAQFIWFGRQIDTRQLRQVWNQTRPEGDPQAGMPVNWNYSFWANPYFLQHANRNEDDRDRLIGQITGSYKLNSWLTATARTGTDWYQDRRVKGYAPQNIGGLYTTSPHDLSREYVSFESGAFGRWDLGYQETNSDFLLAANPDLGLPFTVNATFGGNRRDVQRTRDYFWVAELVAPNVFDLNNAAVDPVNNDFVSKKRVNSLYGQTDFGFNDFFFVSVTGRNDWSSTLPEENRSYFYPSVSTSLVFSDAIPALANSGWLAYGKLRGSWARVGNDTDPYQLRNTFSAGDKFGALQTFTVPNSLRNAELKPETTESWEFGADLGLFDNRLGFDVTYYNSQTFDQIMPVSISATTGYTTRWVNAGTVQNKGWEVLLRGTPIRTRDFRWESSVTWSKNENEVVELAEGVEGLEMSLGSFWGTQVWAREGEPLGQILGSKELKVTNESSPYFGQTVIHPLGIPRWTTDRHVIGNYNPDWRAGVSNEFSYRGARLNTLFDVKHGGELYSVTHNFGRVTGVLAETAEKRCVKGDPVPGYPKCDKDSGYLLEGVQRSITNGGRDTTYTPNTTVVDGQTLWTYRPYLVNESNMIDAGYVKLRELSLSYEMPARMINRLSLSGLELGLIGRNLALWTKNDHIDPETSLSDGNVQGWEYGTLPSARSLGFTISVRP